MNLQRFADLTFEGFRALARDEALSLHEKIGFPDAYRAGKEAVILRDVRGKLTNLDRSAQRVLDIGPGCGGVARALLDLCREQGHALTLIDSAEMLALLPDVPFATKRVARFPEECRDLVATGRGRFDAVLVYSVLQYVFRERDVYDFFDSCLALLAEGGQLLVGDIPNQSMRRRFFASAAGARFHQAYTGTDETPPVVLDGPEPGSIDDAVLVGLLLRARAGGSDAYLVPQAPDLPMANRREDLLVRRP